MNTLVALESSLTKRKKYLRDSLQDLKHIRDNMADGADRSFAHKTYPHSEDIFNLLNPLYINEITDFSKLDRNDYILVRDGFFPLMDFFYRFSRPGGSEVVLLIHEKLQFIIPETWRNNVVIYNIQRTFNREESRRAPKSLYLCATTCDSDVRLSTFRQKLAEARAVYGDAWNDIEVKIGVLLREEPYYRPNKEVIHESFPLVKEIYTQLGIGSEFCTWREIAEGRDFRQACYYYMTENCFSHAYSYIDHFFLSNRCMPFDDRFDKKERGEMIFEMFPEYDIHINKFQFQVNDIWREIINMVNVLGVGDRLFHSEFYPYSWEIAEKYLLKEKSMPNSPLKGKGPPSQGELTAVNQENAYLQ